MNRFTELSQSVRNEFAADMKAKADEAARIAREAEDKQKAQVAMLRGSVLPLVQEIRDGLIADEINAEFYVREGETPAVILEVGARLDKGKPGGATQLFIGKPSTCTVTTAAGVFVLELTLNGRSAGDKTANRDELDEALTEVTRKILRHHHKPFNI